jgi:hypothetical protein
VSGQFYVSAASSPEMNPSAQRIVGWVPRADLDVWGGGGGGWKSLSLLNCLFHSQVIILTPNPATIMHAVLCSVQS